MSRHLGMAVMTVCTVFGVNGGTPASAEEFDAAKLLFDGAKVITEQREIEAKLEALRAKTDELRSERQRINRQAEQIAGERQVNQDTCSMPAYYYTHRAECDQGGARLSTGGVEADRQRREVGQRLESTDAEVESLRARRDQLKRQAEAMERQFKQLEWSGTAQECVSRLPKDDLGSMVSAYQQCWDGTSADQPRLKPESRNVPTLTPGPIEQMGIEDEKRRRRKARQKELAGE